MTRPEISKLVDKNGVPYELEGFFKEVKKYKISAFKFTSAGWFVLDNEGNLYVASECKYIPPQRTLDEIKDEIHGYVQYNEDFSDVDEIIDEAYKLGKSERNG